MIRLTVLALGLLGLLALTACSEARDGGSFDLSFAVSLPAPFVG